MLLCALLLTCACDTDLTETTSAVPDIITEAPLGGEDSVSEENAPSEEATTEEASTEEEGKTVIGEIVGYTSKGYVISRKDGITYVDGVLVANKTYSLPQSYNPGTLLSECDEAFKKMQSDASAQGMTIWNASGFRSYELQQSLYTRYADRDGTQAADRYSARPGHSEHQTGLAIDLNDITSAFAKTAEGRWIKENCHKYGFILRYPEGKEAQTGYMYEPWHIRYVGTEAAAAIYASGLCLEEYYGITSQYAVIPEETTKAAEEDTTEETPLITEAPSEEVTSATVAPEETTVVIIVD